MDPISITSIALFVAQSIADYGINKGLDKIFREQKDFVQRLQEIIYATIETYEKKYPVKDYEGKYAFYKSEILITELMKCRIFTSSDYSINESNIQIALKQNSRIILPSIHDIEEFTSIFDEIAKGDLILKKFEIEAFYKEEIFRIRPALDRLQNSLDSFSIESLSTLENEYKAEIENFKTDLENLRARTALKNLESLEKRVENNSSPISQNILGSMYHLKAACLELTGQIKEAWLCHIKAYNKTPSNIQYLDRACFSYFNLKDEKYKDLLLTLEREDEYNPVLWAVRTFQSTNVLDFIGSHVPKIVIENPRFKRLVFNRYLKDTDFDIVELLKVLEFEKLFNDLPEEIDNDNFYYAVLIMNAVSLLFFRNNKVPFSGFIKRNDESLRYLNLSKLIANAIINGELDENLYVIVFYSYWIESEIDCKKDTILNLERTYLKLNNKEAFRAVLYATAMFKHKELDKTISFLNSYDGEYDENFYSFKSYVEISHLNSPKAVFQYLSGLEIVDSNNIQNVCNFVMAVVSNNMAPDKEVERTIGQLKFESESYKGLLFMLFETLSKEKGKISLDKIEALRCTLNTDKSVSFYISQILYENGFFKECSEFIKAYLDEEEESRDLGLYIYALNAQKKENQVELLRVLKIWREKYSFNGDFLNMELELRRILKDWEEIYQIALYGYKNLPDNESVFTTLILATSWVGKAAELKKQISSIEKFSFKGTESVLRIVGVLIEHHYYKEALELLYKKAQNKSDELARQNFFFISSSIPKKFYKSYKKVKKGRYVKFEIDNEKKTYLIDDESVANNQIVSESLDRSVNDTYSVPMGINKRLVEIRIVGIMNKYMTLSDEIMQDAMSPFSLMPMEQVKIETPDKKGIDEALIKNFGGHQEVRRKHIDENLDNYYEYKISFSELVSSNFDDSYFDGYFSLISSLNKGFLIKPAKFYPNQILYRNNRYVVDFTSGLLFFELEKRFGLKFEKFIISNSLLHLIDNLIRKTELSKNSKMTVSIENNRVIPHLIPKDFHKKRIKRLVEIKDWFLTNCDVVIPEEKLDIMRQLNEEDGISKVGLEYLVDNVFLAQRDRHILISDDFVYSKHLRLAENTCSTEMFLKEFFPERQNELIEFLIECRYVGLTLNADNLYDCYTKQYKEDKNHIFKYALRNISLKSDSQIENSQVIIQFLKKIALNPIVNIEKYKIDTINTLVSLIMGATDVTQILYLKALIYNEFRLMGGYLNITLNCLLDAMNILNVNNSNS
jgi:hypothetical protein